MVYLKQVSQHQLVVLHAHPMEGGEREHLAGQLRGGELAVAGQHRHGLVVEQAVGQAVELRRLHPALLQVELHQGDGLQQLPGDGLWKQRAGLRLLLAHQEPHLGRLATATGAAHALQEGTHGEGRVYLEGALQAADVDAQLERGGGDGGEVGALIAHQLLGGLAQA